MAIDGGHVLSFLRPNGGWEITGNDFDSIQWLDCEPITKAEYEAGFAQYETFKANQEAQKASARQAILDRLGLTAEEVAILLG